MSSEEGFMRSSSDDDSDDDIILTVARAAAATATAIVASVEQTSSRTYKRHQKFRDRAEANRLLIKDYFTTVEEPTYDEKLFKRRFRMSRDLFTQIVRDMEDNFKYFQQRPDATGKQGLTPLQKCTSAIRQLAYGTASDMWDDYLKMSDKTSRDSLYFFCRGIIKLYGYRYLRRPTWSDIQQIYLVHENVHGFPGMLGSIDCTHWQWENCPTAWKGSHQRGDHSHPTIMLEAVASQDLWIWHAYFGVSGSNNDINVLDQSPLFDDVFQGVAPGSSFYANDTYYKYGYYLADGIYPEYATFVKSFTCPDEDDEKRQNFKKAQESARKDVERAFGVLKKKWHIVKHPCRIWEKSKIRDAMYACIILHNMILEDKGRAICQNYEDVDVPESTISNEEKNAIRAEVRNKEVHNMLKADLIEHVWQNRIPRQNNN